MGVLGRGATMVALGAGLAGMMLASALSAGVRRGPRLFGKRRGVSRALVALRGRRDLRARFGRDEDDATDARDGGGGLASLLLTSLLVQGVAGARRAGAFRRGTLLDSLTTVGTVVVPMMLRPRGGRPVSGFTQKLVGVAFYLTGAAATLAVRRFLDAKRMPPPTLGVVEAPGGRSSTEPSVVSPG